MNDTLQSVKVADEARATVAELIDALRRIENITSPGESDPVQAFNMLAKIDRISSATLIKVQGCVK